MIIYAFMIELNWSTDIQEKKIKLYKSMYSRVRIVLVWYHRFWQSYGLASEGDIGIPTKLCKII